MERIRKPGAFLCALITLLLLIAGLAPTITQAQQKELVLSSQMTVVETISGMSALDSAVKVDGEGAIFIASVRNNGADAWSHVVKYARNVGTELWHDDFSGGAGVKIDSVALAASGSTLIVESTTHQTVSPRDYYVQIAYVPNVFTPNLAEPEDGPGAYVFPQVTPGPSPGSCPAKEEIATEVVRQMNAAFGGNVRDGIESKAKDAFRELLSDTDQRGQEYRFLLAQFVRDRTYESITAYFGPRP